MTENSHCFMAMRIDAFADVEKYKEQVDSYIEYLHSLPVKNPGDRIYYPGEIEASLKAKYLREGLPIAARVVDDILALASEYGVDTAGFTGKYHI
jgi:LDH2 family malate/lactate/ureidoglycolate dehydrogenase